MGRLRGFPDVLHFGVGAHFDESARAAMAGTGAECQCQRRDAGVLIAGGAFDEGEEDLHRVAAADAFDEIGADAAIGVGEELVHNFDRIDAAAEDLGDFGLYAAVRELGELEQRHR